MGNYARVGNGARVGNCASIATTPTYIIGEQYFFYSLFLVLNRVDWLFWFIIVYGGLAVIWKPFNAYREYLLFKRSGV